MWPSNRALPGALSAITPSQSLRFVRYGSVAARRKVRQEEAKATIEKTAKDVLVPTLVKNERGSRVRFPLVVEADTSIRTVMELIVDAKENFAFVVEQSKGDKSMYVLGLVTGGDIINHIRRYPEKMINAISRMTAYTGPILKNHLKASVREIMTPWPLRYVTESASLLECLRLTENGIWHIPVLKRAKSGRIQFGDVHAVLTRPLLMQALAPLVAKWETEAIESHSEFLTAKDMMADAYAVRKENASFCFKNDPLVLAIGMMAEKKMRILPVFVRSGRSDSEQTMCRSTFLGTSLLLDCVSELTRNYDPYLQLSLAEEHISPPEFCAQLDTPASSILAAFGRRHAKDVAVHGVPVFTLIADDATDQDTRYQGMVTPRSLLHALLPSYGDPIT
eukprot:gb/GEZN01008737.1/.p1 GENE.gb/GEZN01008737.1/~~gb/GEZN01008737.1/.p1  ORF type:complete len:393 (+),score=22.69 gb/GEZN01008737.1/:116-1294(+)